MVNLNLIKIITGAIFFALGIILDLTVQNFGKITFIFYLIAYAFLGTEIVFKALRDLFKGQVFNENFLMSIATIGAFAIGEPPEAVAVMLFFQVGEYFQEKAVIKSKKSITDLMDIRPDYANIKKDNEIIKVAPDTVKVGDIIIVKPGEKIPLDGIVIDGASTLDTSALTGESIPRKVDVSKEVLSGSINLSGLLTIKVTKIFGESTVSKIINLVENAAEKKAKTENFITKFAYFYTPVVVLFAVILAVLPPLILGYEWKVWIHRALIFLVISCPCALVLSIPLSFFAALGRAAKDGILIKGGSYLEAFNHLDTVVFDKTGTLTKGVFKVTSILNTQDFSKDELLELAAYAECFSSHPIALSILKEYNKDINKNYISEYTEAAGCGVSASYNNKIILAGNKNLMINNNIPFLETNDTGTKVYIAYGREFAGCIVISDEIKPDSISAVSALKERGVHRIVMLTGDNPQIANEIAAKLNIDEVYGGLLPCEKVEKIEDLNKQKRIGSKVLFAGDGINDAPVLAIADIGVAMGALGSDAAIEAADVVLMTDQPSKLAKAVDIAKFTRKIVSINIVFILSVKLVFLLLGSLGIASMWEAVFADVGVSLLAVLNAMRIMRIDRKKKT